MGDNPQTAPSGLAPPSGLDRLHLSDQQHRRLVEALDGKAHPPAGPDKRQDQRYPYLVPSGLAMHVKHPGGSSATYRVRPRNISRRGVGFFHGGFLHQGTCCAFALKTRGGDVVTRHGRVVHTRHIVRGIHEIGAAFTPPIDVTPFVESPAGSDADHFVGHILCVDGSASDRAMLRFEAAELGATTTDYGDAAEALNVARRGAFDLIMVGEALPAMTAAEFIYTLRTEGYVGPVVRWTAAPHLAADTTDRNALSIFAKPFRTEDVIELLRRYLMPAKPGATLEPVQSTLWPQPKKRPLILAYLETLEEQALKLEEFAAQGPTPQLTAVVHEIHGSAGSYGYPSISDAAAQLLQALKVRLPDVIERATRKLVNRCKGACEFRATIDYIQPTATDENNSG